MPSSHLDIPSVREVRVGSEREKATAVLQSQLVIITRKADGSIASTQGVTHDGEELLPYRLLPDGVEMRSRFVCKYRSASEEYAAEVTKAKKEREDAIAHCKKLLLDLPVALSNSRSAMEALFVSADADLSEIGAMTVEQRRIQQEIDAQKKKLSALEVTPEPKLDESRFVHHRLQRSVTLKFGANQLGEQIVHVMRPSDSGAPHAVAPLV